jgi:hypothetical protein
MEADEPLTTNSIKEGEWALVFNGVQGCLLGRVGYLVAAK